MHVVMCQIQIHFFLSAFFFFPSIKTKNAGISNTPMIVAVSIPANTAIPITFLPSAPAPLSSKQRNHAKNKGK